MKIDSGTIWNEASALVAPNKDVLAALAGVFFLLPSFAFAVLMPQPQPQPGMSGEAAMNMLLEFYGKAMPWMIAVTLIQALGQLAAFVLLDRAGRITVSDALREGASALLPYIGSQLLISVALGFAAAVIAGLVVATGSVPLMVIAGLIGAGVTVYLLIRLVMVLPVIAIERQRNPVAAIRQSWSMTKGNAGSILLFFFLMFLAFMVAVIVAGMVIGAIAGLIGGARAAEIAGAGVSAVLGAGFSLYIVASLTAMHRRLSSGTTRHADTFS